MWIFTYKSKLGQGLAIHVVVDNFSYFAWLRMWFVCRNKVKWIVLSNTPQNINDTLPVHEYLNFGTNILCFQYKKQLISYEKQNITLTVAAPISINSSSCKDSNFTCLNRRIYIHKMMSNTVLKSWIFYFLHEMLIDRMFDVT